MWLKVSREASQLPGRIYIAMKRILFTLLALFFLHFDSKCQTSDGIDTSYLSVIKTELSKERPENRNINLVFNGHSGPAGSWNNHEVHTLESYPNLVLKKLKAIYPLAVINIIITAVGGENSLSGEARFESEVLNHKPDVVFIDYTGNDTGIGLAKANKAWESMINLAQANNVKVILITPGADQRININAPGNPYQQHADQVRRLAEKYQIGLADPFSIFQKLTTHKNFVQEYMASVNHFNQEGHEVYAEEIFKWFKK